MEPKENKKINKDTEVTPKTSVKKFVTSSKTVDFSNFNWGIHVDERKELPEDPVAQKEILSKFYITETN